MGSISSVIAGAITPGSIPAGVTSIVIELQGAGGAGGGARSSSLGRGGGGGGGAYAKWTVTIPSGAAYTGTVGTPGAGVSNNNGGAGTATTFTINGITYTADPGLGGNGGLGGNSSGGAGGLTANCTPNDASRTAAFAGGSGFTSTSAGGGGGSSGGTASDGNTATSATAAAAVTGGGPGGAGATSSGNGSAPASGPGGGGGGADATTTTARTGGAGFAGQLTVTWTDPPLSLGNTLEGGTSGITISTANSGGASGNAFDSISSGTGITVAYSNAQAAHGALSALVATGSTAATCYLEWNSAGALGGTLAGAWGRLYLQLTALPIANDVIARFVGGASLLGGLQITTGGALRLFDFNGSVLYTFTNLIPTGAWCRIEWGMTFPGSATGTAEIRLYLTPDSGTATETSGSLTGCNFGSLPLSIYRQGWSNSNANESAAYLDDLGVTTVSWLGPAAASVTAVLATGAGAAQSPVAAAGVNSAAATGTGAAQNATASTSGSSTSVTAVLAAGTGTAQNPAAAIGVRAAAAAGTGAAQNPAITTAASVTAVLATGTGAAQSPAAAIGVRAVLAAGTGAAQNATIAIGARAVPATGTGAAQNASVTTVTSGSATAILATGTGTALNASVTTTVLPAQIAGTYWPYWLTDGGPMPLAQIPAVFNLIYLFSARPVGGTPGTDGSVFYTQSHETTAQLITDIAAARAAGCQVIMSAGGAGEYIDLSTTARRDAFLSSFEAIADSLGGIDGIDWDLEGGTYYTANMIYISRQLKAHYGNFLVTFAAAPWNSVDKTLASDMIAAGALDFVAPQYYDLTGLTDDASQIANLLSRTTEWVTVAGSASRVGCGFKNIPANDPSTMEPASCVSAWTQAAAAHPGLRAGYVWNECLDRFSDSDAFAVTVAPVILGGMTVTAGAATGTGTAGSTTPAVAVHATLASGTGAALNATASTTSSGTANAVLASGAGAARSPVAAVGVNVAAATGTGAAQNPAAAAVASAPAVLATGTGAAQNAAASTAVSVTPSVATGTGTAQNVTPVTAAAATAVLATGAAAAGPGIPAIGVNALAATGTGAAPNASVPGGAVTISSADSGRAAESAFYYIASTGDAGRAAESAQVRVRGTDRAAAADVPLNAWPAARDTGKTADKPASAWPAGDDTARGTERVLPFRFAGADSAHMTEVLHEMGIWTFIPVNLRLLGRFWRITGTDLQGREVAILEGERLDAAVLRLAERVSFSRVTLRVRSADSASLAERLSRSLVAVTCWVQPAVSVSVSATAEAAVQDPRQG